MGAPLPGGSGEPCRDVNIPPASGNVVFIRSALRREPVDKRVWRGAPPRFGCTQVGGL